MRAWSSLHFSCLYPKRALHLGRGRNIYLHGSILGGNGTHSDSLMIQNDTRIKTQCHSQCNNMQQQWPARNTEGACLAAADAKIMCKHLQISASSSLSSSALPSTALSRSPSTSSFQLWWRPHRIKQSHHGKIDRIYRHVKSIYKLHLFKAERETKANHKRHPSNIISKHQKGDAMFCIHRHPTILSMLRVYTSICVVYTNATITHPHQDGSYHRHSYYLLLILQHHDQNASFFHDANATRK